MEISDEKVNDEYKQASSSGVEVASGNSEFSLSDLDPTANSNQRLPKNNIPSRKHNIHPVNLLLSSWIRSRETVAFFDYLVFNEITRQLELASAIADGVNPNVVLMQKHLNRANALKDLRSLVDDYIRDVEKVNS